MNKIKQKKNPGLKNSFHSLPASRKWLLFAFLCLIAFITLPAVIVLLIGLLPTATILITDPKNANKLVIIGCFNLAGVFVYLINVINHFSLNGALSILSDVFNLVIMLGSAAIGFIIYYELPNLFILSSKISAQKRVARIDRRLEKIAEEWGQATIDAQIDKIAK